MFALRRGPSSVRRATAVVGGLLVSTLLTLLVIPATYTLMEDLSVRLRDGLSGFFRFVTRRGRTDNR